MIKTAFVIYLIAVSSLLAQPSFEKRIDEKTGNQMLVGITGREAYNDTSFSNWFEEEYTNYNLDIETLSGLHEIINNYKVKIILGTWCSDSRREIPRMIKIFDELKFGEENLMFINVDRTKNGLSKETEGLNIMLVPTIIFYKNNNEIGRIIETPSETLEIDIKNIIGEL